MKTCLFLLLLIGVFAGCTTQTKEVAPAEARAIAKEAYIYANPVVDSYRILYNCFVDTEHPDFKAPWNEIRNIPRVYTHEDRAVQAPNSDTPYRWLALDLRAEPLVLTVPKMDSNRYFSIEFFDLYSHAVDYIGSRAMGNEGGQFLLTGLAEDPLNRYLLHSTMIDNFVRDEDGVIILYLQHESPGKDKEANWFPAPEGPFSATLRLYWPKEEALNGTWQLPHL